MHPQFAPPMPTMSDFQPIDCLTIRKGLYVIFRDDYAHYQGFSSQDIKDAHREWMRGSELVLSFGMFWSRAGRYVIRSPDRTNYFEVQYSGWSPFR